MVEIGIAAAPDRLHSRKAASDSFAIFDRNVRTRLPFAPRKFYCGASGADRLSQFNHYLVYAQLYPEYEGVNWPKPWPPFTPMWMPVHV